jgi:chemotaxis protein MotB
MRDDKHNEIIIVRRRRDTEDGGKNSVWKIAYADFMTAMMAFFLVMWLINVTDEDTKVVVATYFNPIKLAEATTDRKGLRDPEASSSGSDSDEHSSVIPPRGAAESEDDGPSPRERPRYSEAALFQDPYAILAKLAAELQDAQPPSAMIDFSPGDQGEPGLTGGDAFRDPFDPVYWQVTQQMQAGRSDGDGTSGPVGVVDAGAAFPELGAGAGVASTRPETAMLALSSGEAVVVAPGAHADPAASAASPEAKREAAALEAGEAERAEPAEALADQGEAAPETRVAEEPPVEKPAEDLVAETRAAQAEEVRRRIAEEIARGRGRYADLSPVDVVATPEGILISLTDNARFGMFAIGSAEPRPEVVRLLEGVAGILQEREGSIVIRGHTDARPFRSPNYDNWRLSTARAHMAYYMLVRGGFDEARIARVEGHADRMLKVPEDPEAAENRRIEILLAEAGA